MLATMRGRLIYKAGTGRFEKGTRTDTTRNPLQGDQRHPRLSDDPERSSKSPFSDWAGAFSDSTLSPEQQQRLFHRRISTRLPDSVVGRHLAFACIADDGGYFFCKVDAGDQHPARAAEWLSSRLARHVGLPTADCAIIEDLVDGTDYFGSKRLPSISDRFAVADFLDQPHRDELGQIGSFPGQFLAMLRAFDLFIDNPDRGHDNFVLTRDGLQTNLCPIDFASARLFDCTTDRFPVAGERTNFVGNFHQRVHGRHLESAVEMLDRIAAVPASTVNNFLNEMPESWLSDQKRGNFYEFWSDDRKEQRLKNLHIALSG